MDVAAKRQKVPAFRVELNDKKSGLVVHVATKPFEIKGVENY